jgi:Zn-dependent protease with chaperone function/pimeloyl-ACP methyl ester carboxylesterase
LDIHGNTVAWLLSQAAMTAAEEFEVSQAAHAALLRTTKTVATPDAANRVFRRLVEELPVRCRPAELAFSLTVLDVPETNVFTTGAGFVCITAPFLRSLLDVGDRGSDMLAFFLAHELGHVALGHTRRGYQLMAVEEEIRQGLRASVDREWLERALETSVNPAGTLVRFLYSRAQEYEADLFALHLCRNAATPIDHALDAVRLLCLLEQPQLAREANDTPRVPRDNSKRGYFFSAHPDPFRRLLALQRELRGTVDAPGDYGLFVYDRHKRELAPANEREVAAGQRAIVFMHGMEGGAGSFLPLMQHLAARRAADEIAMLEFRYPNDQSLARSGEFLVGEMNRVCAAGSRVDFVCHSAGGLVFRWYAEVRGGAFCQAVFQGTPHGGSDLARLRTLLELTQFLKHLKLGYPKALSRSILDGQGQIAHDLLPDSLFLRHLARFDAPVEDYHIIRGQVFRTAQAALLETALSAGRLVLAERAAEIDSPLLRRTVDRWIELLQLPDEIKAGDLAVSLERATLAGVEDVTTVRESHLSMKRDGATMQVVEKIVLDRKTR